MGKSEWAVKQADWETFREDRPEISSYTAAMWQRTVDWEASAVNELLEEQAGPVLDVGTDHTGLHACLRKKDVPLYAVDPGCPPEQALAPERAGPQTVHGFAETLPFDDDFARVICFRGSLDHFQSAARAFVEAERVLSRGGGLVVSVNNRHSALRGARELRDRIRGVAPYDHMKQHMYWYALESLRTLLCTSGFEVETARGIGFLPVRGAHSQARRPWVQRVERLLGTWAAPWGDVLGVVGRKRG